MNMDGITNPHLNLHLTTVNIYLGGGTLTQGGYNDPLKTETY